VRNRTSSFDMTTSGSKGANPAPLNPSKILLIVIVSDMRVIGELSENQRITRGPLYLVTVRSRTILDGPWPWHAKD
jgi:hypothetical protein